MSDSTGLAVLPITPVLAAMGLGADDAADASRMFASYTAFDGIPTEKFAGKTIAEFVCGEAYIEGMNPSHGSLELGLSGLACQMLAESFAGQFEGSGATNFLEVNMSHDTMGPFTVTIQRAQGKTPGQLRAEALTKLADAKDILDVLTYLSEFNGIVNDGVLSAEFTSLLARAKEFSKVEG